MSSSSSTTTDQFPLTTLDWFPLKIVKPKKPSHSSSRNPELQQQDQHQ